MTDVANSVGFLLSKAYQRACALYKERFDSYGLTPQQCGVMRFLWEEDGISQIELSNRSQIDRTTIGGLIDRLEQRGYLVRLPHPDDRRAYRISLTDSGRELKDLVAPITSALHDAIIAPLSENEAKTLVSLLKKLR